MSKNIPSGWQGTCQQAREVDLCCGKQGGFSLIELVIVVLIVLTIAGFGIPAMTSSIRQAHLRGAASDYAGLLEQARMYAIRDNRYYSTYILTGAGNSQISQAYVDMLPKKAGQASGNGGTGIVAATAGSPGDPQISFPIEAVQEAASSAPNTSNLQTQLLPSTTTVTPTDASVTAPIFSPRGLPCTPVTLTGLSVCDSSGGPTAYWTFFQDSKSHNWQAVTVTPAGRIKKWFYNGSTWSKL
jgi:prepilin-type N-terminal cleavage/methylation domain-containing protein